MKVVEEKNMHSLLDIRDLCISFERDGSGEKYLHAVNRISLRVEPWEIVGIIGQSGSGKTTLIMGILGLLRGAVPGVWRGEAFLDGKSLLPLCGEYAEEKSGGKIVKRNTPFQSAQEKLLGDLRGRDIVTIFQEPRAALDPYFRVGEHMLEALRRSRAPGGETELRTQGIELLQDVGLVDAARLWDLHPHQISGGMAQRVMIAMALCARPKLLVADEPSTALDVTTQAKLLELFRRLRDKHGLAILLISHDIGVIQEISQRVYVMRHGEVVESGETREVLENFQHPYTGSLVKAFAHFEHIPATSIANSDAVSLLEIKSLRKRFQQGDKSFWALDDVSLELREGETYALVGESGSGKSTLALSLMVLQTVNGGEVLYKGEDVLKADKKRMRALRREIRMLFQHPEAVLNPGMTVGAILSEGLEKDGEFTRNEIDQRISEVLDQVHLDPSHALRFPGNLSTGEKQRVTIARALITRPKLLVCDEPVSSLDLAIQAQIMELLREFQGRLGLTYLFISHNLQLVKLLAHRIGVMYMGRLVEEAPAGGFTTEGARHPYTRLLLASVPSMGDETSRSICAEFPDVEPVRLEGGCLFRNRCPWYLKSRNPECENKTPPLRNVLGGGKVACHLAGD